MRPWGIIAVGAAVAVVGCADPAPIVPLATEVVAPVDPYDPRTQITALNTAQALNRLSPARCPPRPRSHS